MELPLNLKNAKSAHRIDQCEWAQHCPFSGASNDPVNWFNLKLSDHQWKMRFNSTEKWTRREQKWRGQIAGTNHSFWPTDTIRQCDCDRINNSQKSRSMHEYECVFVCFIWLGRVCTRRVSLDVCESELGFFVWFWAAFSPCVVFHSVVVIGVRVFRILNNSDMRTHWFPMARIEF